MQISVSQDVLEKYPSYILCLISATGIRMNPQDQHVEEILHTQEEVTRKKFSTSHISEHPHIASWRRAYSSFGSKPSKFPCAVESLSQAVIKRGALPRINPIVDLCNAMALKYMLPIDVMDTECLKGNVRITFAEGTEPFIPLGTTKLEYPDPGEVIYMDDQHVLGRKWNWRKCDKNKVTNGTQSILITIEGIGEIPEEIPRKAADELAEQIKQHFGAQTIQREINAENNFELVNCEKTF